LRTIINSTGLCGGNETGARDSGEWSQLAIWGMKDDQPLQVDLADQDAVTDSESDGGFRYEIEASTNGRAWRAIAPAAATGQDPPHA